MGADLPRAGTSASRPHVGQVVVWGILLHAIVFMRDHVPTPAGERDHLATVCSLLPEELLASPFVFPVCRDRAVPSFN